MKDFFADNYMILIEILLALISLIIVILKKTKIVSLDTAFEKLLEKLPDLIKRAEVMSSLGKVKKSYVLSVSFAYLADLTGKTIEEISGNYSDRISKAIESILETPRKKDEYVDEEKKDK